MTLNCFSVLKNQNVQMGLQQWSLEPRLKDKKNLVAVGDRQIQFLL